MLRQLLRGDPSRTSKLYLVIGVLSLVKAIAIRDDTDRFRRELRDAGLFLAVGLVLRQYSQLKAQKRADLESSVPDWLAEAATSDVVTAGTRELLARRRGEPEQPSGIADRARALIS